MPYLKDAPACGHRYVRTGCKGVATHVVADCSIIPVLAYCESPPVVRQCSTRLSHFARAACIGLSVLQHHGRLSTTTGMAQLLIKWSLSRFSCKGSSLAILPWCKGCMLDWYLAIFHQDADTSFDHDVGPCIDCSANADRC